MEAYKCGKIAESERRGWIEISPDLEENIPAKSKFGCIFKNTCFF